jgi:hemoglobin-like flavoprotein
VCSIKLLTDLPVLVPKLQTLAKIHSEKGVMSYQYGIVGEVLLWTLNKCLGAGYFEEVKVSWVKVYSIILSVMVPEALKVEADIYNKSQTEVAYTETKSTSGTTTTASTASTATSTTTTDES